MADNNQLNYGWLYKLTNPHHDGTTQQADDFMQAFVSETQFLTRRGIPSTSAARTRTRLGSSPSATLQ